MKENEHRNNILLVPSLTFQTADIHSPSSLKPPRYMLSTNLLSKLRARASALPFSSRKRLNRFLTLRRFLTLVKAFTVEPLAPNDATTGCSQGKSEPLVGKWRREH